jgi:hypothetical protein
MSQSIDLTLDELTEVVRTCKNIYIEDCTPPYLQDFIAARLALTFPELSTKVRRFAHPQMDGLCGHIKRTYELLR